MTDERRRLLERAFSREGANEAVEEHLDPSTGETVHMTSSQWALAEYDRLHGTAGSNDPNTVDSSAESSDDDRTAADATGTYQDEPGADAAAPVSEPPASEPPARSIRRALPYLTALGGLALGIAVAVGVEGALGASSPQSSTAAPRYVTSSPGAGPSTGSGEGDEGATLAAVTNYFDSAPGVRGLPTRVTKGFETTSFHEIAGRVSESSAIYAAHRLDDEYCLVAVGSEGRTAETCGTMDDIARRGLTLSKDAGDGAADLLTVTWQTDGTISWAELPTAG